MRAPELRSPVALSCLHVVQRSNSRRLSRGSRSRGPARGSSSKERRGGGIGQSQRPASNGSTRRRPPRVKRLVLSANDLARKCAGLGWDDGQASYADSGAAKVQKAIKKLREGKATTAAALAALKKTQHVPEALLKLARDEVVRAIGVTRFDVLNAEVQWKEQGARDGSREGEAVIQDRQTLLDVLQMQIEFASKLGIAALVAKDAELNAAVDAAASAGAAGSFATTIEIATDTSLDMRLVAGVLALREVASEVAKDAVYYNAGKYDPYILPCEPEKTDAWYSRGSHHCPDFALFKKRLGILHATATAPHDKAAVAATNALFRIFPGFSTAKLDAMAKLVPAILKDVGIYNEIFKAIISSTPQAVFDELKRLAATPSQLPDWKSRIKKHPGDPAPDSLEYVMVARHRAAGDSITFYNSVHTILTTKLPTGCQAAAMPGLVKAEQRIIFKTALSYSGDGCFGRCNDIVRLTVRVETMEELLMVLKALLGSEAILVLRQKHRLAPDKDMSMIGGYRDYQLLVAFKRDTASIAADGGPEYAVGEIQINLANFIDIKEGVVAGGGGGHGPYKLARSFNGYSPETLVYTGAPSMALAQKIEGGMLLSVTIAGGSENGVDNLEDVGKAIAKALVKPTSRVKEFDFGGARIEGNAGQAEKPELSEPNPKLIAKLLPILPSVAGLTRLAIAGFESAELQESLQELVKLQSLDLVNCKNFATLPEWLSTLVNLQSLNLGHCSNLTTLPEGLSKLVNLQSLNLNHCSNLTMLPEGLCKLVSLQSLNLGCCEKLTMLPEGMSELVNLQSLNLSHCKSLAEPLPDLSHLLPALEVEIEYTVSDAVGTWKRRGFRTPARAKALLRDGPSSPATTTFLDLSYFAGSALPEWVSKLVNLQSLDLGDCSNLTMLPEGLGKLVNLQSLNLNRCSNLTVLPEGLSKLVNLQSLDLNRCSNLTMLPEGLSKLVKLQSLNLGWCEKLTMLPEGLGKLVKLQSLDLGYCSNLTMLPEGLGKLVKLQSLDLFGCSNLTMLPEGLGELVNLQSLNLNRCANLTVLPEGLTELVNLQSLVLYECTSLAEPLPDLSILLPKLVVEFASFSVAVRTWEARGFKRL